MQMLLNQTKVMMRYLQFKSAVRHSDTAKILYVWRLIKYDISSSPSSDSITSNIDLPESIVFACMIRCGFCRYKSMYIHTDNSWLYESHVSSYYCIAIMSFYILGVSVCICIGQNPQIIIDNIHPSEELGNPQDVRVFFSLLNDM